MKKLFFILLSLLFAHSLNAQVAISNLTALSATPADTDYMVIVDDETTDVTKKITIATLRPAFEVSTDSSPVLGGDLSLGGFNIDFPSVANISDVLDEDTMSSNSATKLATQQSIKAYVDASPELDATVAAASYDVGGLVTGLLAREAISFGEAVYLDNATTGWKRANAGALATAKFVGIAANGASTGQALSVIRIGTVSVAAWSSGFLSGRSLGDIVYLSETTGSLTCTVPTTSSSVVQVIGFMIGSDAIYVQVSPEYSVNQ